MGLGARVWFEYVRSKANVADTPSRFDLEGIDFDLAEWYGERVLDGLVSEWRRAVVPDDVDWKSSAAEWAQRFEWARSVAV